MTSPILYEIDREGAAMLRSEFGYPDDKLRYTPRGEPSLQFLEHTMGLAEIRLAIELACQKHGLALQLWQDEKALKAGYDRVPVGNRLEAVLPDAYFVLGLQPTGKLHFFLEYDRGLEGLKFVKKKMAAFVVYFEGGNGKARYDTNQIRVLMVCSGGRTRPGSTRLDHLVRVTEAVGGRGRFYFTELNRVTAEDILVDPIWQRAGTETTGSLLPAGPGKLKTE